jgi:UPF0755 protein
LKKVLLAVAALAVLGAAAAGYYVMSLERAVVRFGDTPFGSAKPTTVEVPRGTGPKALGRLLAQAGVISDADLFYRLERKEDAGPKLKHGEYEFVGPLTPHQVLAKIISGEEKAYHFTVPEGLRVDEILPILADSELHLDPAKLSALAHDKAWIRAQGVPADSLEGFLFPDTYTFTQGFTEKSVLAHMVKRTLAEYRKADAQRKAGVKLNLLQTVTLGSIIEKETAAPEERARISCVFHNRLRLGMRLGTDPTVLYAMMLIRGHFVKNITRKDLETQSPYNTYQVVGLPPGPIASPGAAALQAALHPIDCHDLYFVSRNNGTHVFCPTLQCHEAAVQKWQREYFKKQRAAQNARRN